MSTRDPKSPVSPVKQSSGMKFARGTSPTGPTAVERSTLGLAPGLATAALESVSLPLSPTFGCWMGVLHEQPSLSREQSLSLSILGRHIGVLLHRLHIDIDRLGLGEPTIKIRG